MLVGSERAHGGMVASRAHSFKTPPTVRPCWTPWQSSLSSVQGQLCRLMKPTEQLVGCWEPIWEPSTTLPRRQWWTPEDTSTVTIAPIARNEPT